MKRAMLVLMISLCSILNMEAAMINFETPGIYAKFDTNKGEIICELFSEQAPKTVHNFVGLASGLVSYQDPKTNKPTTGRFYDGLIFHRVIPDFMIQGGCPLGAGTGGPGFQFEDEFNPALQFNRSGLLAMANSGPGTNGSQFFITTVPTPWLNNKHTIFGQVIVGQDIIQQISQVAKDGRDKPLSPVIIKSLRVIVVQPISAPIAEAEKPAPPPAKAKAKKGKK